MGTTITACIKAKDKIFIANVGDSGCLVIKKDGIIKITKDHSYVQELLDKGSITAEEADNHPYKNIITKALGSKFTAEIDIFEVNLIELIKVILCTDGLSKELNLEEILNIVINNTNQDSCIKLVELSKLRGGKDNISVIIFDGNCELDL